MDAVETLLNQIEAALPEGRTALRKLKTAAATRFGGGLIRNDRLLQRYRAELAQGLRQPNGRLERILTLNSIRSDSGIATVTVITEPYACPGRCVYCPTEARAPKSYLTNEPAVMRALRNNYDPYRQVTERLSTLHETGHATDKVELIVKGGTWSFYPAAYQREFIRRCFEAANHFAASCKPQAQSQNGSGPEACSLQPAATLDDAQCVNETAQSRLIGITIETRPDYVDTDEILRLRELGVTRVELGVQSLEERVLELIVRDHGVEAVQRATRLLKDAGIKVAYHLMPNLPGATPASDLESARQIFTDEAYQADTIKLYPCVVIETAELFSWWQQNRYQPYDDDTLVELLIGIKSLTPPYVRIERVIRDIPSTSIRAGCLVTNLREAAQRRMASQGLRCRCIRCRQVRADARGRFTLTRRAYPASGGTEIFLSFEDAATDRLASLLRLRIPSQDHALIPTLQGAALVRELHSYGHHLPLLEHSDAAVQHHGFGRQLLAEAERIVRAEFGLARIAVIAGVGAREYYRRFGYELEGTYMVKSLGPCWAVSRGKLVQAS